MLLMSLLSVSCVVHSVREDFGPQTTRTVRVDEFDRLSVNMPCRVVYAVGSTPKVTVKGPKALTEAVEVRLRDGKLSIAGGKEYRAVGRKGSDGKTFWRSPMRNVTITVQSPSLREVSLNGAADFEARRVRTERDFLLDVRGACEAEIGSIGCANADISLAGAVEQEVKALACGKLNVSQAGASDMKIEDVRATDVGVKLTGACETDLVLTGVETTKVEALGASDAEIKFRHCGTADVSVIGASDIDLSGQLRSLTKNKQGAASIDDKELRLGR